MPLIEGKSPKSFDKNLKTEMHSGKPLKQSLAIAYSMKRKARKKMADGGTTAPASQGIGSTYSGDNPVAQAVAKKFKGMSDGGFATNSYQEDDKESSSMMDAQDTGYQSMPKDGEKYNSMAMSEDEKDLNQHGAKDMGPMGSEGGFHSGNYPGGDIVDRIMAAQLNLKGRPEHEKEQMYSEGGRVANNTSDKVGADPAEYDDLVLDDHLSSTYGDDDNAGDDLGNSTQDDLREDIVSKIMRSLAKRDRMPRPA